MVCAIDAIQPVGCCSSVNTDFYIEQVRKSYRYKKEIEYFNENIKNCPTIFPDSLSKNSDNNNEELTKSNHSEEIQNNVVFKESKQNNIDNNVDDLFMNLINLINQRKNANFNNELSENLKSKSFGPPLGLKIEKFDYWESWGIASQ